MKLSDLVFALLYVSTLSVANPLRNDDSRKRLARSVAYSNATVSSMTSVSSPTSVTSTSSLDASQLTVKANSVAEVTASPSSDITPNSVSRVTTFPVFSGTVSFESAEDASLLSTASATSRSRVASFPIFSGTVTHEPITEATPLPTTSATSVSRVATFPVFSGTLTHEPITDATSSSSLSRVTSFSKFTSITSNATAALTTPSSDAASAASSFSSVRFTLNNTLSSVPIVTPSGGPFVTTFTFVVSSFTAIRPSLTSSIAQVPTAITTTPTSQLLTPSQVAVNLAQAQAYNSLFSSLNFSSPCSFGEVACLSGNVGFCTVEKSFSMNLCSTGTTCAAVPMNETLGVFVGCVDQNVADAVLGVSSSTSLGGSPEKTTTSTIRSTVMPPVTVTKYTSHGTVGTPAITPSDEGGSIPTITLFPGYGEATPSKDSDSKDSSGYITVTKTVTTTEMYAESTTTQREAIVVMKTVTAG